MSIQSEPSTQNNPNHNKPANNMNISEKESTHNESVYKKTPHVLMILDGFGHRTDERDNSILVANTPNLERIKANYPHGLISASSEDVGLPDGQFGNSEVGHMNIGAGRVLFQDSTRISIEIRDQSFFKNEVLTAGVKSANQAGGDVHILGLLSDGGVHAHQDHIEAMCLFALKEGANNVYIHCFLDGRDTPPKSADKYVQRLQDYVDCLNANDSLSGKVAIASMIGRYFAMDRDNRWDRVQQAYELMTEGKASRTCATAMEALKEAYLADEKDEFVSASLISEVGSKSDTAHTIKDNDAIIFMNFRADRAREISQVFVDDDFDGFTRIKQPKLSAFVMLTKYSDAIESKPITTIAYKPTELHNTLGEYLQNNDKTQLRIAETEKFAHVTFFMSGGREDEYEGETRILIPSPDVTTYDLKPEMSAFEVADELKKAIESGDYDLLIVNFANGDMVGHTGVFEATVQAVEALDKCVGIIAETIINVDGHLLITADHGNCEQMMDYESGQVHTQHTTEPVPLIYVGNYKQRDVTVRTGGRLSDIAPTLLELMGMEQPEEMTGESLLQ